MSDENKTLQQTIGEAVSKQETATKSSQAIETEEGMSQEDTGGETQAGETPTSYQGIDISDIPEQDRPKFLAKLSQKFKIADKGIQEKMQEVAKFKKAQEDLVKMGLSVDEAYDVLSKHVEQKRNPVKSTEQKKEAVRTLDKLIEEAPYEQRSALEQMRQIILEETESDKLRKEVNDLKQLIQDINLERVDTRKSKTEDYLNSVSEEFGKDLIDKYRQDLIAAHIGYRIPLDRLIQSVIPFDELKQAILSKGKKPLTQEKKNAISSSGSGVTSATEKIDTKNKTLKEVLAETLKLSR